MNPHPHSLTEPIYLYRWYNVGDMLIYIGISRNPLKRGLQHLNEGEVRDRGARLEVDWTVLHGRLEALAAERAATLAEGPAFGTHNNGSRSSYREAYSMWALPEVRVELRRQFRAALGSTPDHRLKTLPRQWFARDIPMTVGQRPPIGRRRVPPAGADTPNS